MGFDSISTSAIVVASVHRSRGYLSCRSSYCWRAHGCLMDPNLNHNQHLRELQQHACAATPSLILLLSMIVATATITAAVVTASDDAHATAIATTKAKATVTAVAIAIAMAASIATATAVATMATTIVTPDHA